MRIFAFLFSTLTAFSQELQELFWSSMCEVMGKDFYEMALDQQNGDSLVKSTRKSRGFIDTVPTRALDMFDHELSQDERLSFRSSRFR